MATPNPPPARAPGNDGGSKLRQGRLRRQVTDPNHVTALLFDMDGLLLDTERVYTDVTQSIVQRFGKDFTWDLKARMMGRKATEAAQLLVDELQIPLTAEAYLQEREEQQDRLFPSCELLPGVERLVRHLKAHKYPIAVATSSHRKAFELKTARHKELFSLFDVIVTGDDTELRTGKPAPDIFLLALQRLQDGGYVGPGGAPETTLVFEDAPNGVEAGKAARMLVCMVPDAKLDRALTSGADQVLGSLEEFNPAGWGLPDFA